MGGAPYFFPVCVDDANVIPVARAVAGQKNENVEREKEVVSKGGMSRMSWSLAPTAVSQTRAGHCGTKSQPTGPFRFPQFAPSYSSQYKKHECLPNKQVNLCWVELKGRYQTSIKAWRPPEGTGEIHLGKWKPCFKRSVIPPAKRDLCKRDHVHFWKTIWNLNVIFSWMTLIRQVPWKGPLHFLGETFLILDLVQVAARGVG